MQNLRPCHPDSPAGGASQIMNNKFGPGIDTDADTLTLNTYPKIVLVTGGTVSGLGKGTAISSLGVVLKSHGFVVTCMKIDPYLNIDAGTMSPFEHGEVFVLDDGAEADLDLGNYERFLNLSLSNVHSLTSGKVYERVLHRERAGDYLGKTVQMVPHVTDCIQDWILNVASIPCDKTGQRPEICLIELGGTVGDIESAVYLEALQQLCFKMGSENFCTVHLGYIPYMDATGEQKTKPCQHSVKTMREAGLKPDLLFCRSKTKMGTEIRQKLSLFCQVLPEEVISLHDVSNIFHVPILLAEQNVGGLICRRLGLQHLVHRKEPVLGGVTYHPGKEVASEVRLGDWNGLAKRVDALRSNLRICIVGKYTGLTDSYMSVIKALNHACIEAGVKLDLDWIESTNLEPNTGSSDPANYQKAWDKIQQASGVLVPGGFGNRGIEGMILAAKYCRENKVPYFGICVGFQIATIEAARNLLNLEDANSTEFNESTPHPVVIFMPEGSTTMKGGTMRLGSRCTIIRNPKSLASRIHGGMPVIYERHRHRYEVNTAFQPALESAGFLFTGQDERGQRMEIAELSNNNHPFYFGVQFHPEFKSRPNLPAPTFLAFILAAAGKLESRLKEGEGKLVIGSGFQKPVDNYNESQSQSEVEDRESSSKRGSLYSQCGGVSGGISAPSTREGVHGSMVPHGVEGA